MLASTIHHPIEFLAVEISETSRLTRELTAAAGNAIATLAGGAPNDAERQALHRLMVALQAQDRVEQRLTRLEAFARALDRHVPNAGVPMVLRDCLQLDELLAALDQHMSNRSQTRVNGQTPRIVRRQNGSDVEMFE